MRTLLLGRRIDDFAVSQLKDLMRSACGDGEPTVAPFDDAQRLVERLKPELIVVALANDLARAQEAIHVIRALTEARILAVGPITDSKLILRTLELGADLFLDQDELETNFTKALGRLFSKFDSTLTTGRLIAVISACGGCGASMLAVNIAAILREHGRSGLIDLHPGRGDLAALLDVEPTFSMLDVCLNEPRLDRAMLGKMLTRHSSGIHLLAAAPNYEDVRRMTLSGIKHALALTRVLFHETIVDLEDCIHAEQVEALRQATSIFVVARLDFTSLRNARRLLDCLNWLEIPRNHVKVVINHQGQANELLAEDAEEALGQKAACFVLYDPKTVMAANNTGTPAILKFPNSPLAQAIAELVAPFIDQHSEPRSGFLRKVASMIWKNSAESQLAGTASACPSGAQVAYES